MRRAGLSFLCVALFCGGCSFLQVHSYYAPSASGGDLRENATARCGGDRGHVVSGPPHRIVVRSSDAALGIQAGAYRVTTVAAGPLSLPVLPAFPPSFFPHSALEDGDVLPIDFRILEPRDESVDFSAAVVEVSYDAALAPVDSNAAVAPLNSNAGVDAESRAKASTRFEVGDVDLETVAFERWTSLWDLSDGWTLPLRVGSGAPAPFRVSVRGLLLRGKRLDFPEVEFTPARGWLVCEGQ